MWILHASPEGHGSGECFNRVVLGSTCSVAARSEYAWWCSRKGMKKRALFFYLFIFFKKKVLNDLPALLLTLHWDAAVRFRGASWTPTWVKLWFKRESGREICSSSLIKQPRSFPDSGFAYDNCCCNQTFHSLQLCGPPSMFIRIELFVSTAHSPLLSPPLLLLLVNCMNMGSSLKPCSLLYVCAPDRDPHPWRCRWQPRSVFLTYRAAGSAPV